MVGRSFVYSGSANGMTVFKPSLPPVSWITTRMVSLAPALSDGGAARAVRLRKAGTVSPMATRDDVFRKSRRFCMGRVSKNFTTESQRSQRKTNTIEPRMEHGSNMDQK